MSFFRPDTQSELPSLDLPLLPVWAHIVHGSWDGTYFDSREEAVSRAQRRNLGAFSEHDAVIELSEHHRAVRRAQRIDDLFRDAEASWRSQVDAINRRIAYLPLRAGPEEIAAASAPLAVARRNLQAMKAARLRFHTRGIAEWPILATA